MPISLPVRKILTINIQEEVNGGYLCKVKKGLNKIRGLILHGFYLVQSECFFTLTCLNS